MIGGRDSKGRNSSARPIGYGCSQAVFPCSILISIFAATVKIHTHPHLISDKTRMPTLDLTEIVSLKDRKLL
jgi:hypothetical protein